VTRITTQDCKTIAELYREGHTYKEIAVRVGSTPSTVSYHARKMGLPGSPLGPRTNSSGAAPTAPSAKQQRTEIAARLLKEAVNMLDAIHESYIAYAFGGKDFKYVEHRVSCMPRDKADLARAAVLLLDEHRKLTEFDSEDGAAASRSVLGALAQAIGMAAVELEGGRVAGEILAGTAEDV
jgi:hypothetical protein